MKTTAYERRKPSVTLLVALFFVSVMAAPAESQDLHPIMESKWWVTGGTFLAERDFKASAGISLIGEEREIDFERSTGIDDSPNLIMGELGWRFTSNWNLALQYFRSSRDGSRVLEESFEWQGTTYDAGVRVDAETETEIIRIFIARRFRDEGPHSLRLGAGFHWLSVEGAVSGQATLNDQTREFRRSAASAEVPVPNLGIWYRYSPHRNWIFNARVDWLSASIDNFSGTIWNGAAGVGYRITDHIGVGVNYQYFELSGDLTEPNWYGEIKSTYTGPHLYLSGYW